MHNPFENLEKRLASIEANQKLILERLREKAPAIKRYSLREIADNTPISFQTVHRMVRDGRIKAEKLGHKYMVTEEEFQRALREVKSMKYKRESR